MKFFFLVTCFFLHLHFPGLCPTMWSVCASSRFHLFGPTLQGCTASLSSQTLAACPRGAPPACGGTTGTSCHRSRAGWGEGPAEPRDHSSYFLPLGWWGTVHLGREVTVITNYSDNSVNFYLTMIGLTTYPIEIFLLFIIFIHPKYCAFISNLQLCIWKTWFLYWPGWFKFATFITCRSLSWLLNLPSVLSPFMGIKAMIRNLI